MSSEVLIYSRKHRFCLHSQACEVANIKQLPGPGGEHSEDEGVNTRCAITGSYNLESPWPRKNWSF